MDTSATAELSQESPASQTTPQSRALAGIPLEREGIVWHGDSQIVHEFLTERSAPGCATVVKSGPHRAVYRIELPSATVFLKHFKIADWRVFSATCR